MDTETPSSARTPAFPDRELFLAACVGRGIDPAQAEAVWRDLTSGGGAEEKRGLSRSALAIVVIGAVLLSGAGIWWATLVTSAAGAPGLFVFALGWIAAAGMAAEAARRRGVRYLDGVLSVIAVAYAGVAVAAGLYSLAGSSFASHWWGRAPVEAFVLAAGVVAAWRYREPVVTMAMPTLAAGLLMIDTVVSSFGGWDRDITEWPAWTAFAALALAGLVTGTALVLDRRGDRVEALWPALLADFLTVAAIIGIAAGRHAGPRGIGMAAAIAGLLVLTRGVSVARLAQLVIGAGVFWFGVITFGSTWGGAVVAALTTLAGVSMIAGAVGLTRRRRLLTRTGRPEHP
jgi:hypothetical protein